jgi:glycosyltransferase involved in cell wall biosynthesis
MKISVLIPAYNSAATIAATLDSVLSQTVLPDEILVMNDGSTDDTSKIVQQYEPKVEMFWQPNSGLSSARNALIAKANGDLIAFLDSDDLWHPNYLETHRELFEQYPHAAALFAAHANFDGFGSYIWDHASPNGKIKVETLDPAGFFRRFQVAPGHFIMSFCCIPKRVLEGMGSEPFKLKAPAEDVYVCNLLPFWGPVVFASAPLLGAYRGREGSLASNRLNCAKGEVEAFHLLEKRYTNGINSQMVREFKNAFASKRRAYAKILQGIGRTLEAREQLKRSLVQTIAPASIAKSLMLLFMTYLPRSLQPQWPAVDRV